MAIWSLHLLTPFVDIIKIQSVSFIYFYSSYIMANVMISFFSFLFEFRQMFIDSVPFYWLCYLGWCTEDGEHENERGM